MKVIKYLQPPYVYVCRHPQMLECINMGICVDFVVPFLGYLILCCFPSMQGVNNVQCPFH
jgi:hypothetical protein